MRPQQNRRMRGRGGNNNNNNNNNNNSSGGRKGPNPLTRSYESNGPDVKIRGSAQQIAEKYTTLARDAQSSGDRVMAENYLQHAEHYNRIIMAAQAQMPQQPVRDMRDEDGDDEDGEEGFNTQNANDQPQHNQPRENRHQQRNNGTGPQPVIEGVPAEVALNQQDVTDQPVVAEDAEQPEQRPAPRRARGEGRGRSRVEQPAAEQEQQPEAVVAEQPEVAEESAVEGEEQPVRKTRRPRRPRLKAGEEATPDSGDEPVTEAAQ